MWVYSREHPFFFPIKSGAHLTLQRMDGATDVDAWLYFPAGVKVGQN
jgi:hypothetical protein